ncbi:hypothetical protein COLO4_23993 [Corchorus olitorius]|uniref:Uncharacterized protein n=1 Tax=Corchorus olitorius TaxID=93759 RepID=A0A1R3IDP0_9ROSI|nr:hypothetical protein COLO4_23993 [Corchorus olitorius]
MEKKKKKRTSKLPLRRQSFRGREVSGISDFPERTGKRRRREREQISEGVGEESGFKRFSGFCGVHFYLWGP